MNRNETPWTYCDRDDVRFDWIWIMTIEEMLAFVWVGGVSITFIFESIISTVQRLIHIKTHSFHVRPVRRFTRSSVINYTFRLENDGHKMCCDELLNSNSDAFQFRQLNCRFVAAKHWNEKVSTKLSRQLIYMFKCLHAFSLRFPFIFG